MFSINPFSSVVPPSKLLNSSDSSPPSTLSSASSTFESKGAARKGDTFIYKHGQRHHSYDSEKAPYPLSYDRSVLELEPLENKITQHLRGSVSFINHKQHPERVLDLGCGLGTWIVDAAKEWPNCEFVGFDLMNIQVPIAVLEPSITQRIEWRHGNFLTTRLPFEDDEFDHVHVSMIARGVPENKWGNLFEEINRVLAPGGSCEVIEEDIVFPILPRWFTQALRPKPKTTHVHLPNGSQREYTTSSSQQTRNEPSHDHALLESLNRAVYEQRFINIKPTAVLPSYFTTYFRQVTIGPVLHFPMPPLAPLQPLPPQIITTYVLEPDSDTLNTRQSTYYPTPVPMNRPASLSFSSTVSSFTNNVESIYSSRPRTASATSIAERSSPPTGSPSPGEHVEPLDSEVEPECLPEMPMKRFMLDGSLSESEIAALPEHLFPVAQLSNLSDRSLAMQLYRSCQAILGCQEAMWEELKDRILNRKDELTPYGWDDDEELEELQNRKKFEKLIERFKTDMHLRISLWYSLTSLNWPLPEREPLTKAELIEEERIRSNMLEARKQAKPEDFQIPCRSVRVLLGYKL